MNTWILCEILSYDSIWHDTYLTVEITTSQKLWNQRFVLRPGPRYFSQVVGFFRLCAWCSWTLDLVFYDIGSNLEVFLSNRSPGDISNNSVWKFSTSPRTLNFPRNSSFHNLLWVFAGSGPTLKLSIISACSEKIDWNVCYFGSKLKSTLEVHQAHSCIFQEQIQNFSKWFWSLPERTTI